MCRRARLPTKDDSEARTVYVERLPAGATIEAVKALLGEFNAQRMLSKVVKGAPRRLSGVPIPGAGAPGEAPSRALPLGLAVAAPPPHLPVEAA